MAQNKKTDAYEGLPELTEMQYQYVLNRLSGKYKYKTDCYRNAYDASNMANESIQAEVCKLENHPHISLWLQAAQREHLKAATYTIDQHLQELDELKKEAQATGNYGAAVQALINKGKVSGHHIERHQDMTPQEDKRAFYEFLIDALQLDSRQEIMLSQALGIETKH